MKMFVKECADIQTYRSKTMQENQALERAAANSRGLGGERALSTLWMVERKQADFPGSG